MSELIDREALLDECLNHYEVGNIEQNCTMDWICKTVRNFPAAPRWVRCEDRLPDDSWQRVLATDGKELWLAFCYGRIGGDEAKVYWKRAKDGMDVYAGFLHGVTHWMPIEPPKEGA